MRAEHCDWSAGAQGVKTMLGVSLRARCHTTQVMLGLSVVTAGQVGHNSSNYNYLFISLINYLLKLNFNFGKSVIGSNIHDIEV